jgi:hypothetical protein
MGVSKVLNSSEICVYSSLDVQNAVGTYVGPQMSDPQMLNPQVFLFLLVGKIVNNFEQILLYLII